MIGNGASTFSPTIRWYLKNSSTKCASIEASAVYGLFGAFFVGLRFPAVRLESLFEGKTPSFT